MPVGMPLTMRPPVAGQKTSQRPGGVPASPVNNAPQAGPGQPPTDPPSEYTDTLGDVYRWNPGGFTGIGLNAGVSQGEWRRIGSVNQPGGGGGRGPGPGGGGGGNPFDFWSQYNLAKKQVPQIPPRIPQIPDADRTAAESAAFGRAKDRVGLATQGLLKSIRNNFAKRGLSGSPLAMSREAGALESGAGQIGEVIRDQAIEGLRRQYDVRDQNYQGDISQRGQDISAEQARQNLVLSLVRAAFESGRY